MRLDAGVRRQSTRVTIINGPQPALAQASEGPYRAVERSMRESADPGLGPYAVPLRTSATPASAGFRRSRAVSHKTVPARAAACGVPLSRVLGRECRQPGPDAASGYLGCDGSVARSATTVR